MEEGECWVSFSMLFWIWRRCLLSSIWSRSILWLSWVTFLCVIPLLFMLFFFILIQMTMPVFGIFWFGLMLFKVSENHYPVASMSTGSGPTVNPLALNSLAKKKWSGIWEALKIMASTLKRQIFCVAEESRREKVWLLSFCILCLLLGKGCSAFLLKKYSHCLENCWERKNSCIYLQS